MKSAASPEHKSARNNPLEVNSKPMPYSPRNRLRFITAASLFDGHDASINIVRRILQGLGAEVVHLGHNRSVKEIVDAAIQEDAQAISISSYQGGHLEFFKYVIDLLKERGSSHIKVFGGGGGTITPNEAQQLEHYGVNKIYSPDDGLKLGLQGMVEDMMERADLPQVQSIDWLELCLYQKTEKALAQALTCLELGDSFFNEDKLGTPHKSDYLELKNSFIENKKKAVVIGITGTGGAGKSSLTDELILRCLQWNPTIRIAVLAIDPTRKKTGGALLGDRLRMNSLKSPRTFMRSFATGKSNASVSPATQSAVQLLRSAGFDWIFVETGGIGQADTSIVDLADINVYVMTPEYGAPTQLEKINMLDYADLVVLNKFEKTGSLDALNDVKKQFRRNHREFEQVPKNRYPVFGTIASRFADKGVTAVFQHLKTMVEQNKKRWPIAEDFKLEESSHLSLVPGNRALYLSEISTTVRSYHNKAIQQCKLIETIRSLEQSIETLESEKLNQLGKEIYSLKDRLESGIDPDIKRTIEQFLEVRQKYQLDSVSSKVGDKTITTNLLVKSLSHNLIRKVSVPKFFSKADLALFALKENFPGYFPFTAGVFPFRRTQEDPKRQFAGEGTPERTNKRFHLLCLGEKAKRLSTAFDSVTLYGQNPDERPDIYGKIGESGVSIATLEDLKRLYSGFDLCDPDTSVSMTINGPAPMLLAFFFNTAIDQRIEKFEKENNRKASPEEWHKIKADTLKSVRGTVQADILKEDQAQNTCLFSTEFSLAMMGDLQQYFINNEIKNYYSVSISGYHIAEAGANPITQLAFTLANGFTFVEYYLSRGMQIDQFASSFSFFFSNGLDPEYTVIGRVARRIWAIAMKHYYGANERSQKLKYHIQTSGRSLHAQEISFNDVRTTLQALIAHFDNCNSLHTNAYDEAVTTPTEESVRRAMAIQLIISKELGWAKNENPLQGSFFIEELTDLVEKAVLNEFDKISQRGGVLGAMETHYQRSQIQEESLHYEQLKHSGEFPIVGVNTFLNPNRDENTGHHPTALTRATPEEKKLQIDRLQAFHKKNAERAPLELEKLKNAAKKGENIFEVLLEASRYCSLGQLTQSLYEVGGEYRRSV